MSRAGSIEWKRRAKRETTDVAERRIWESRCGLYRVVESQPIGGLSTRYYAQARHDGRMVAWANVGVHRAAGPAFESCERVARQAAREQLAAG